jgi:hypothetical protein
MITLNGDTGITTPGLINTGSTTLINLTTTGNTILGDQSTDTLNVANGNLVLNSSGNLGVGTASPASALYVKRTSGNSGIYTDYNGTNVGRIEAASNGNLYIGITTGSGDLSIGNTANATALNLSSSGNFGIGTASPNGKVTVIGNTVDIRNTAGAYGTGYALEIATNATIPRIDLIDNSVYTGNIKSTGGVFIIQNSANAALTLGTNNTERVRITSGGNLLVGTTADNGRLSVAGTIYGNNFGNGQTALSLQDTSSAVNQFVDINLATAGGAYNYMRFRFANEDIISWGANLSAYAGILRLNSPYGAMTFNANGSERARITSGGNFLVGTTGNGSPGFGVANSTNISFPESTDNTSLATMFRQAGSGDLVLGSGVRYSSTSNGFASSFNLAWARSAVNVGYGAIKFFTAAEATVSVGTDTTLTERARFDPSGNLGVGRTDPPMRLSAAAAGAVITGTATIGSNMQGIQIYNTTTATTNNAVGLWFATGPHQAGIASFRSAPDSGWDTVLAFYTHNATTSGLTDCYERMRVDGEGNVLVGTTSSNPSSGGLAFANTSFLGGAGWGIIASATSTASSYVGYFKNPNGAVGSIITSGSSTAYNTASDYRLKADIQPMTDALAKVASLKPVTYKWKIDGSDGQGFIAHELAEVMPQAVTGIKDAVDAEGNPQYQGIDVSFLVATLTAAIQELKAELDSVKSELATIKGAA